MSKTTTTARIRADGKVVKVSKDGNESPFIAQDPERVHRMLRASPG
jgi:hypothetical protein